MSVAVGRLRVRARVPRRIRGRAADVLRVAREILPGATARRLAGRLPSQPSVCRIQRLQVRVKLSVRQLDDAAVADAWAEAFCAALLTAMNQPPSSAIHVAESSGEWLASVIAGVLDGRPLAEWPFDEFAALDGLPARVIITALVRESAIDWRAVLHAVAARGLMARLVRALGAPGCGDVLEAIESHDSYATIATLVDLVGVARALAGDAELASAARAEPPDAVVLRLMARGSGAPGANFSARSLRAATEALIWLADRPPDAAGADLPLSAPRLRHLADAPALLAILRSLIESADPVRPASGARAALEALLPHLADPSRAGATTDEVHESAMAGLLFLVPVVERLEWPERIRRSALGARYGSRALTYILTGAGLALAGEPASRVARFDPAVAVFAGWFGGTDPGALVRLCRDDGEDSRAELLRLLGDAAPVPEDLQSWDSAFVGLGSRLLREFAGRLRGLSRSSDRFLIDRILAVPGTLTIAERSIRVALRPQGLWPALHISGVDTAVDTVTWMGGRRLEFLLEGL